MGLEEGTTGSTQDFGSAMFQQRFSIKGKVVRHRTQWSGALLTQGSDVSREGLSGSLDSSGGTKTPWKGCVPPSNFVGHSHKAAQVL